MSGSFQDGFVTNNLNSHPAANEGIPVQASKRRRISADDSSDMEQSTSPVFVRGRSFLPIHSTSSTYQTQDWKSSGTALFCPVGQDLYINLSKYDQISAAQGSFYTADEAGNFEKMVMGHVLHLWRFDKAEKKNYISQSFLFTNYQEFINVQTFLQNA